MINLRSSGGLPEGGAVSTAELAIKPVCVGIPSVALHNLFFSALHIQPLQSITLPLPRRCGSPKTALYFNWTGCPLGHLCYFSVSLAGFSNHSLFCSLPWSQAINLHMLIKVSALRSTCMSGSNCQSCFPAIFHLAWWLLPSRSNVSWAYLVSSVGNLGSQIGQGIDWLGQMRGKKKEDDKNLTASRAGVWSPCGLCTNLGCHLKSQPLCYQPWFNKKKFAPYTVSAPISCCPHIDFQMISFSKG